MARSRASTAPLTRDHLASTFDVGAIRKDFPILARRVHGSLPPDMEAYTRGVTMAWCVFFAAQVIASALLFKYASLNIWSLFITIMNFPLLVLMFVSEYAYRLARHRDFPHASILKSIQAFASDAALSKSPKAR